MNKTGKYERLINQLNELLPKSNNLIAKCSTISAILYNKIEYFFWAGFYFINDDKLLVGPYQGPIACLELEKNRGVCWACFNTGKSIIVPDVEQFPGHIACDSRSKSEIVIPVYNGNNEIIGVLDIDSKELNSFDEIDRKYLEIICKMLFFT